MVPTSATALVSRSAVTGYAIPTAHPREADRLNALHAYEVLDTEPEPAFDALTALAAEMCGASIAAVSLVDSARLWFKSVVGLDCTEAPRHVAFCAHAILADQTFVIADTMADPRFAGHPLVAGEPNIRMYAGAPLMSSSGLPVGALCVMHDEPRELSETELRMLRHLGDQVQMQLELRAINCKLKNTLAIRNESERTLLHEATHDQLTGLANRRLFNQTLDQRCAGEGVGVVYIDLDGFKQINDTRGHDVGDQVLVAFARRLRAAARRTDVVVRLGGDEFAIITGNHTDALDKIGARIRRNLDRPVNVGGELIPLSASIGIARAEHGADPADVVREADQSMYAAKRVRAGEDIPVRTSELCFDRLPISGDSMHSQFFLGRLLE